MVQPQQRKKLDSRIPALIANGVQTHHRSFFVLVGDRGRDQVVTLHFLLSKARVSARPSVLWCYKKELGFSSHRKKRMNQIKRQIARGIRDADEDDPFELFVSSTNIRYTYYKETEKILGNTYGMCVLQDFEALTPNLLARTIETVEGGGIVVLLLRTMNSLKQLYTMTMDVHSRYRTESHQETVARFNERFILSLGSCETCLVLDDELNVLPLSKGKGVKPLPRAEETTLMPEEQELKSLKESLADTQPVGSLVATAKTLDQARAILTFVESIAEKTLRSTVSLTASRGRGKSAALGIAIAAAVAYGYSNIFITSPSPENLKTLFEFLFKGFDALGYEEHLDYDIIQSTNPAFQKAVVRVNIFREHRQTIQWIQPTDHHVLAQAELVVIDEAAAIPLPVVKSLLGPYLVFMASTINGYEGTGRSLSLKLLQQLRERSVGAAGSTTTADSTGVVVGRDGKEKKSAPSTSTTTTSTPTNARTLREITLTVPIRYSSNDPVESWLNKLLCLDCCTPKPMKSLTMGCPHPSQCELFYVNRDTLFSYHPVSEAFLQRMMGLYVASHYKNSPNDLQLMSDAPAHHLFVLLPPLDPQTTTTLPEPLCVLQICLEGSISKGAALSSLSRGVRSNGDLIPWVVSQQFQDDDFATLSGARVVRIATSPEYVGMGYGKRSIELLEKYFKGEIMGVNETVGGAEEEEVKRVTDGELVDTTLETDEIRVRDPATMPPLLLSLADRPPRENLQWLGVSYGLTPQLHKFWKRSGFVPLYLRQTPNDLTGEHTCIMVKSLGGGEEEGKWVGEFAWDFRKRFLELLGYQFRKFGAVVCLSLLEAVALGRGSGEGVVGEGSGRGAEGVAKPIVTQTEVYRHFTPFDLKRFESYAQNLIDYHVVVDLTPALARSYFLGLLSTSPTIPSEDAAQSTALEPVKLSAVQAAILLGIGLQKKTVDELETEMGLPAGQIMALFAKIVRKCSSYLSGVVERGVREEVEASIPSAKAGGKKKRGVDAMEVDEAEGEGKKKGGVKRDLEDEEAWDPAGVSLEDDLEEGGGEALKKFREKQRELIDGLNPSQYAITAPEDSFEGVKPSSSSGVVSVKNPESTKKRKLESGVGTAAEMAGKVRGDGTGVVDPKGLVRKLKEKKKGKGRK
ncbi:N-acetyltransferase 10 [Rhizophlyctis rosea]|nr:N-acetyltransferase 10 [Rhizophlyctis rosea]